MNKSLVHNASKFLKPISNHLVWEIEPSKNDIYLTFDDGPHPNITPWVLKQLHEYNFKATFFLVGENAARYPEIVQMIIDSGHHIGNHTYNHLKGWANSTYTYYRNILRCEQQFKTSLFRPPYGRITRNQHNQLSKRFRIIMWSVLSGDYNHKLTPEYIVNNVVNNTQLGSIIVFHDSEKAEKNLKASLPKILQLFAKKRFKSKAIPYDVQNSKTVRGEGSLNNMQID